MIELIVASVLQLSILTTDTETITQEYEQAPAAETTEQPIGNGGWDFD